MISILLHRKNNGKHFKIVKKLVDTASKIGDLNANIMISFQLLSRDRGG